MMLSCAHRTRRPQPRMGRRGSRQASHRTQPSTPQALVEEQVAAMERTFRINVDGHDYHVTVEEITEENSVVLPDAGSMRVPKPASPAPEPPATNTAPAAIDIQRLLIPSMGKIAAPAKTTAHSIRVDKLEIPNAMSTVAHMPPRMAPMLSMP